MSNIQSNDKNLCFAALKLIEQLYKEKLIPDQVMRNILGEYTEMVDVTRFAGNLLER
jgi:hypothetical protein